ncbi:MAG TPA: multicopper oxidase family protein [Longimicrobium sp.]|nr:multicopper oxidase family protein [Longimicrobium sp.]
MTHLRPAGAALLAVCLLAGCATAQNAGDRPRPAPGGRCAFVAIDVDRWGKQEFRNPPEVRSQNGVLNTTLSVQYTDPATTSLAGCPLTLRSYNGQLVGPTLRVKPGDVMRPLLDNRLPRETPAQVDSQFQQEAGNAFITMRPYSFNTTNLHTHGLHVPPGDSSDNVLLAIGPQTRFQYHIPLPDDHTRGTYWYHAHAHGSTAIQVGSAMAGALIVDDEPGAIPASLAAANAREKVMVIQTMLYDTAGEANNITAFFPDGPNTVALCRQGNSGCTWLNSGRQVTINGQIVPVIRMRPGEVQRWRLIDASFRETMALRLEGHLLHEIATDGIYTGRIDSWGANGQELLLFPGYRSDVLVQASMTPGTYPFVDDSAGTGQALRGVGEDLNLLALVVVEGEPMHMQLPTLAEMAALNPFPNTQLALQADGVQEAVFKLGSGLQPSDPRNSFQVNYYAFDDTRVRYLQLNDTDMWSLTTVGDPAAVANGGVPPLPHVFHIHINPFQVLRTGPNNQPQWVWKDTQAIPAGDTVNIYTQYLDYTGKFVMHCHILDHEDLGMMEVIEVVEHLPVPHPRDDGTPDRASGGRAHGHGHARGASSPSPYPAPAQAAGSGPHRH